MTSLQVNPLYKPVFDKLDAIAVKELNELDKSVLWSRKYTKHDFKHFFWYPLLIFIVAISVIIHYGVRYRVYYQYIKHGRHLEFADKLGLDLEDVDSYPKAVQEYYLETKHHKEMLKRKEGKMIKVENSFHKFAEKRIVDLSKKRQENGLRKRRGRSNDSFLEEETHS